MNRDVLKQLSIVAMISAPTELKTIFNKIATYYIAYTGMDNPTVEDRTEFINEAYNAINLLIKIIATASNGVAINAQVKIPSEEEINKESELPTFGTKHDSITLEEYNKMTQISSKDNPSNITVTATNNDDNVINNTNIRTSNEISKTENDIIDNVETNTGKDDQEDMAKISEKNRKAVDDAINNKMSAKKIIEAELNYWGVDKTTLGYKVMLTIGTISIEYDDTPLDILHKVAKKLKLPIRTVASAAARVAKYTDFSNATYVPILASIPKNEIDKEFIIKELADFKRKDPKKKKQAKVEE